MSSITQTALKCPTLTTQVTPVSFWSHRGIRAAEWRTPASDEHIMEAAEVQCDKHEQTQSQLVFTRNNRRGTWVFSYHCASILLALLVQRY